MFNFTRLFRLRLIQVHFGFRIQQISLVFCLFVKISEIKSTKSKLMCSTLSTYDQILSNSILYL